MIIAKNLTKTYPGRKAIDNVTFTIQGGEIVGLLGLNGAGKSTILKILGCFLMPSAGRAEVGGFSVDENPQAIRRLIGYLPDHPPLYDEMNVYSYLSYVARLKSVPSAEVSSKVDHAMGVTNLTKVKEVALGELSHGFRQRVGIAQAIVHQPKVIILDEPINGLDPVQIVEMRDLITSLRGKHTVILSSHILSEITKTCDRILIVDQGQLIAEGSEAELSSQLAQQQKLSIEVENYSESLQKKLVALPGITNLKVQGSNENSRFQKIYLESQGDLRSKISELIVNEKAGLLGMVRLEAGLEGVFLKLIKPVEER
jgi:ABC-2 type transport system ATP-binding protein